MDSETSNVTEKLESSHIISHGFLRRIELLMVAAATLDVEETASDPPDQQGIVDRELHH